MKIKVGYKAVDGFSQTKTFKTLNGARKYAQDMVGQNPDMGNGYAISSDGVGRVMVDGCAIYDLFNSDNLTDRMAKTTCKCGGTGWYEKGWSVHNAYDDLVDCGYEDALCDCEIGQNILRARCPEVYETGTEICPF